MNDLFCRYADTPSRQYDSPPTPTRPYADSIPHTPIQFSSRRYGSPPADTFRSSVGIVRVFYGTLPLHKGVIADYNL
jgi:hypothetical protein